MASFSLDQWQISSKAMKPTNLQIWEGESTGLYQQMSVWPTGWRVMRTVILLTALCQLHPLRASWGRRPLVFRSWAQAGGSRMTVPYPRSSLSFLGPASQVCATLGMDQAQVG